ncbi:MAG: glycoside hydrolase family 43 protein [Proteiniphilum sp.]|nr:glycoside hydrolase family 43 protein [Proteiniphilum sp.]MDD3968656.1 glycoside hydrolase family 43 protein [Proteiniphilum sp.]MDD4800038.1 glycoside hydrolase family 43 protein [Proteiniphilum sp.]
MKIRHNCIVCALILLSGLIFSCSGCNNGNDPKDHLTDEEENKYPVQLNSIKIRDPFIFVDHHTKTYYLHYNPYTYKNLQCLSSKDLKNWKNEGYSFTASDNFWGVKDYWAPDEYAYNGKYYLFVTFSDREGNRGTSVLTSATPDKNFIPLINAPLTPIDKMALDAALWIDEEDQPWIVYCHEWLQVTDGRILAQKVTKDLTKTVGDPIILFSASDAPWTKSINSEGAYITDAPFLYRAKNNELLMIWSGTSKNNHYAIGVARSQSGKIEGPWIHETNTLNNFSGGHAMIFEDLEGILRIAFHSPNSGDTEHAVIYKLIDQNGKLFLGDKLE